MWQIVLRFGFLAAAILLLLLVSEYALFLKPRGTSWLIGGASAALIGTGLWLGRMLFARRGTPATAPPEATITELGVSPREFEVLQLVADGLSNQEIADRLFISESTVKSHVSSLLTKLQAKRRTHAVRKARHMGLLT